MKSKLLFKKELEEMMHAFGDDEQPADDTVQLLEEMVLAYMLDLVEKTTLETDSAPLDVPASKKKKNKVEKLKMDPLLAVLREYPDQYACAINALAASVGK